MVGALSSLWKESFEFFFVGNLRLFGLATLNNFKNSMSYFLKYFWWILIVVIFAQQVDILAVQFVALFFLNFFFVLSSRPSIEPKDYNYFVRYLDKVPGYFFVIFFFATIALCFNVLWLIFSSVFAFPYALSLAFLPVTPIVIAGFFLVDLRNNPTNVATASVNSLKFCLYFLPVVLVSLLCERLLSSLFILPQYCLEMSGLHGWVGIILQSLVFLIVHIAALLPFSALSIYYIKIKHNHHKLFFSS